YDGERHRQRVHGGDVRPLSRRAHRGGPAALPGDDRGECPRPTARVVGRWRREGDPRMSPGGRRVVNHIMSGLTALAAGLVILPLVRSFAFRLLQGAPAVNVEFFTHLPKPFGEEGGGMANAIVGSLILIGLAATLGLPIGILGGVYLAESRDRRMPWLVRFLADVLNGVPSIVIGIFAYTLVVLPMRRFSAVAGGVGPAVIMLAVVVRTTGAEVGLG